MANTYSEVSATFQDIANAIKGKGISGKMKPTQMASKITAIPTGGITPSGEKLITTTASTDVVSYATAKVSDANLVASNIITGKTILGVAGTYSGIVPSGNINITTSNSTNVASYATAKVSDAFLLASNIKSGVTILGVAGTYSGTVPTGTLTITSNGTYDVKNYASASINVSGGGGGSELLTQMIEGPLTTVTSTASKIDYGAFVYRSQLTTVSFPACMTIGSSAFCYCKSLTTASFPSCTTIGS